MSEITKAVIYLILITSYIIFCKSHKVQYHISFIFGRFCLYAKKFFITYFNFLYKIIDNKGTQTIDMVSDWVDESNEYYYPENKKYLNTTSTVVMGVLFNEIKKKYQWKYNQKLTDTDKSVILNLFMSGGIDYNEFIDYVNTHPIVSSFLIDKFIELYYTRKLENKPINIIEMKMFIETARLFK